VLFWWLGSFRCSIAVVGQVAVCAQTGFRYGWRHGIYAADDSDSKQNKRKDDSVVYFTALKGIERVISYKETLQKLQMSTQALLGEGMRDEFQRRQLLNTREGRLGWLF
jgi:hypothetical protein